MWDLPMLNKPVIAQRLIDEGLLSIGDGYRAKNTELSKEGIPFARAGNINDGFKFENSDKFPEDDLPKVGEKISRPGDILFTSKGTVGRYALVTSYTQTFVYSPQLCYWRSRDHDRLDPAFLYYYMQGHQFRSQINGLKSQTDMADYVSLRDQRGIELVIPDIRIQRTIASQLRPLDEKIELNRKQNCTLEAIAQTLFKRWFVEFEFPDENGRPYKSSGGTMQPSELGDIPVGWNVDKLEELIGELETGSRPKGGVGMYTDGVPSIGAESITRIGEYNYAKTKYVPSEYFSTMRRGTIKDRDVLMYKDGGTPGRFDIRISMFGGGFPYEIACLNEHVFRLKAKRSFYQNYLYLWLSSYPIIEELRHRGAKAAIPGINSSDVKELDFLFMDEGVLENFDLVIEPLFSKLLHNSRENAILAKLRDTLLPKLMSGELRIEEAACG